MSKKPVVFATIIIYLLIASEIVIMISPFALYFYSVYGPILNFLSRTPYLGWTTEFFLPHIVFSSNLLIQALSYLQFLFIIGLILFLCTAGALYYGRFRGTKVVCLGFYRHIRHPQYLFLALSGFGLLLYWPRFIVLILYVTMLFIYYLLAMHEEAQMLEAEPGLYEGYRERTAMFVPFAPGGKIYNFLLGWLKPKGLGIFILYLLTMGLAISGALALRSYTVAQLPLIERHGLTLLPVFPWPEQQVDEVYAALNTSAQLKSLIEQIEPDVAYIFPGDYFLTALVTDADRRFSEDIIERFPEVLEWHRNKFRGGLGKFFTIFYNYAKTLGTVETDYEVDRIIFVRVRSATNDRLSGRALFSLGVERKPILLVDLDAHDHEVLAIHALSGNHKWGSMAMPTF